MAGYIELNGIRTWYDEQGTGAALVLLHPGGVGVDSRAFEPNLGVLASKLQVFLPERRGHGHTPDADGPYTYELMAFDMIHFFEQVVGGPARLLGMSDGAIVALLVAHLRPDLVQRLACIAGPFHRSGWVASAMERAWKRQHSSSVATGKSPLMAWSITRSCRGNLITCIPSAPP